MTYSLGTAVVTGAVPAMTVNRVCGSGAQAIVSAAQEILLGNANVAAKVCFRRTVAI